MVSTDMMVMVTVIVPIINTVGNSRVFVTNRASITQVADTFSTEVQTMLYSPAMRVKCADNVVIDGWPA